MSTFSIASRILVALGTTSTLLAVSAAGCGTSGASSSSASTGTGGASTSASTSAGTGGAGSGGGGTTSSSTGNGGAGQDAGDAGDAAADGPACVRRPFLVAAVPRAGQLTERGDWIDSPDLPAPPLDAVTAAALAAAWAADGVQEHASIAAFSRFTMLLVAVGAPPDLIIASQKASLDEVAHARGCFGLARRLGGKELGPGPVSLRGVLPEDPSLADVAALTVHEGCVGETLGVLLATEQLATATDPATRALLERIVRDEQRHADLAWRFTRWALAVGGAPVRAVVEEAFADAVRATLAMSFSDEPGVDEEAWAAHGRLTGARVHALVRMGVAEIVDPCQGALLAPDSSAPSSVRGGSRAEMAPLSAGGGPRSDGPRGGSA